MPTETLNLDIISDQRRGFNGLDVVLAFIDGDDGLPDFFYVKAAAMRVAFKTNSRISVFKIPSRSLKEKLFIRDGFRYLASKLLEAITHLGRRSGSGIVLVGNGLGGVLCKEAMIEATRGGQQFEDFRQSIAGLVFHMVPHIVHSNEVVQETWRKGLPSSMFPELSAPQLRRLVANITQINHDFTETGLQLVTPILNVIRHQQNASVEYRICLSLATVQECHYSDNEYHSSEKDWWDRIAMTSHPAPKTPFLMDSNIRPACMGFYPLRTNDWTEDIYDRPFGSLTSQMREFHLATRPFYLRFPMRNYDASTPHRLRSYFGLHDEYFQIFYFDSMDHRRNSIKAMLSTFLAEIGNQVDISLIAKPLPRALTLWSAEDLFSLMYETLSANPRSKFRWILANLDERIKDAQWFLKRLEDLATNTDFALKIAFINKPSDVAEVPSTYFRIKDSSIVDECIAADNLVFLKDPNRNEGMYQTPRQMAWDIVIQKPHLHSAIEHVEQLFQNISILEDAQTIYFYLLDPATNLDPKVFEPMAVEREISLPSFFQEVSEVVVRRLQHSTTASDTLDLLLFSRRPLSKNEIMDFYNNSGNRSMNSVDPKDLHEILKRFSGLFIVQLDEVIPRHSAVRASVLSVLPQEPFVALEPLMHFQMTKRCIDHLVSESGLKRLDYQDLFPSIQNSQLGFLSYASIYWPIHAALATQDQVVSFEGLQSFLQNKYLVRRWTKIYAHLRGLPSDQVTAISILTEHELVSVIEKMLPYWKSRNCFLFEVRSALGPAARTGNPKLFNLLLELDTSAPSRDRFEEVVTESLASPNEDLTIDLFRSLKVLPKDDCVTTEMILRALRHRRLRVATEFIESCSELFARFSRLQTACESGDQPIMEAIFAKNIQKISFMELKDLAWTAIRHGNLDTSRFLARQIWQQSRAPRDQCVQSSDTPLKLVSDKSNKTCTGTSESSYGQKKRKDFNEVDARRYMHELLRAAVGHGQHEILNALLELVKDKIPTGIVRELAYEAMRCVRPGCLNTILQQRPRLIPRVCGAKFLRVFHKCLQIAYDNKDAGANVLRVLLEHVRSRRRRSNKSYRNLVDDFFDKSIKHGYEELSKVFIFMGVQLDRINLGNSKTTIRYGVPLFRAAWFGRNRLVVPMLEAGADPNDANYHKWTPLHAAAYQNNVCILRKLIEYGTSIDMINEHGETALILAAKRGHLPIIQELVKHSRMIDIVDNYGHTALTGAIMNAHGEAAMLLLDARADPCYSLAPQIKSILHSCVRFNLAKLLKRLLLFKVDMNGTNDIHETPLHCLQEETDVSILALCINKGANITARDGQGFTPLSRAVAWGSLEQVKFLVSKVVNLTFGQSHLNELLLLAFQKRNLSIVQALRDNGAMVPFVEENFKATMFQTTCFRGESEEREEILTHLLYYCPFSAARSSAAYGSNFHIACLCTDANFVEEIMTKGAQVDATDLLGRQPIHHAMCKSFETVKLLRRKGATLFTKDKMGRNALHFAVTGGELKIVRHILDELPSLLHETDTDGWSPLFWALRGGIGLPCVPNGDAARQSIILELIERGAEVDVLSNDKQWSPYRVAKYHGMSDFICNLLPPIGCAVEVQYGRRGRPHQNELCDVCFLKLFGKYYTCCECPGILRICFKCAPHAHFIHSYEHRLSALDDQDNEDAASRDSDTVVDWSEDKTDTSSDPEA